MMQDKDLTDDVLDEIIAGAKTSMERYLALSLKAERANRQQSAQQNIPENIPTLREAVDTIRSSGISIDAEKILAERDSLNPPVIPDGWVMVPVDATRAMIDAAARVEDDGYDAMHKAMIVAAPKSGVKCE